MKTKISCDWCGKETERYPSQIKKHNFCSRECLSSFSAKDLNPSGYADLKDFTKISKHMSDLNKTLNPFRMNSDTRRKLRISRLGTGKRKAYTKTFGRHTHRVVAEKKLNRPLQRGEVVHHIDENKWNNRPENLMVFSSQSAHLKWHKLHNKKEGDAQ